MPKLRYLSWAQYGELVTKLADSVNSSGEKFDLVVGIARGGIPVAMVVSDRLGSKIDFINVKSYTDVGERVKPKILTTIIENISGKRVLVVDDLVDGGETMETVTRYLGEEKPPRTEDRRPLHKALECVRPGLLSPDRRHLGCLPIRTRRGEAFEDAEEAEGALSRVQAEAIPGRALRASSRPPPQFRLVEAC